MKPRTYSIFLDVCAVILAITSGTWWDDGKHGNAIMAGLLSMSFIVRSALWELLGVLKEHWKQ